jgi:small subunit ribosomal protein S13
MAEQELKHLVRVARTDLEGKKQLKQALLKIKGVGVPFANMVCTLTKISPTIKTGTLSDEQVAKLDEVIGNPAKHGAPAWMMNRRRDPETNEDKHLLLSDISFIQENDVKILRKTKSYRGVRHALGLPVRGQRTRSNFRKNKGKVQGVQRKKVAAPQSKNKDKK